MDPEKVLYTALFSDNEKERKRSSKLIRAHAEKAGIYSASTYYLYKAAAEGKLPKLTVPAINMRTLTYDFARIIFQVMKEQHVGAFIFELSRLEMWFTHQTPNEFVISVLAAALKEEYKGPVFFQGDHFQFNARRYRESPDEEITLLKKIIDQSLEAQIYNIDIDASTLVDLTAANLDEQQKENYLNTAKLAAYIRQKQPSNVTVGIGGEIGHIGERNSTVDDLKAFMNGLSQIDISKVSVATGTTHGGILLSDGSIAKADLDFSVLKNITKLCREEYGIGGTVQHGASTLSKDLFGLFPQNDTLEIHLASSFSNIVYENMPDELRNTIYTWMNENLQGERKPNESQEQFIYNYRKKALGTFKREIWGMPDEVKTKICKKLKEEVYFLFETLNVFNTKDIVTSYIT